MMIVRFVNIVCKQNMDCQSAKMSQAIGLLQHDLTARGINFSAKSVDVLMLRTAGQKKEEQQSNSDKKD